MLSSIYYLLTIKPLFLKTTLRYINKGVQRVFQLVKRRSEKERKCKDNMEMTRDKGTNR